MAVGRVVKVVVGLLARITPMPRLATAEGTETSRVSARGAMRDERRESHTVTNKGAKWAQRSVEASKCDDEPGRSQGSRASPDVSKARIAEQSKRTAVVESMARREIQGRGSS